MSQHVHELSHQNKDEGMSVSIIKNGPSCVANRPEILSHVDINRNTSRSAVRNSFNQSPNNEVLKTISNDLKDLHREITELCTNFRNYQYLTLGVAVSE